MKTVQISLNSIDKVKSFVNDITKFNNDFDLATLLAIAFPLAPTKLSFNGYLATLGKEAGNALCASTKHSAINEVGVIFPFTRLLVLAAIVDCDAEAQNRHATCWGTQIGITGKVSADYNSIDTHIDTSFTTWTSPSTF